MTAIDEKVDRSMRERAAALGGGAVAPVREWPARVATPEPMAPLVNKNPPSVNPAAANLKYNAAAETRDVAARLAAFAEQEFDPTARELSLTDSFAQAQLTAREYLNAEEEFILASIRMLIERHRFSPQLFNNTSVQFDQPGNDGKNDVVLRLLNDAGVRWQLPTGGQVAARWVWNAVENLRTEATGRYTQSSQLVLDANIPLLRGAGDVAQESLIQAERGLVYAARDFESFRRDFLVSLARDFFALMQSLDAISNQKRQLESFLQLQDRQRAWYEAGLLPEFDVNLATNEVLQSRAALANLTEVFILQLDRYKVRLGLPVVTKIRIKPDELPVPEPDFSLHTATEFALDYRLDLQNQRDKVDDSKRQVANAKNALLPDLNLVAATTVGTDPNAREGGLIYKLDEVGYSAGALFSLPLDRETEKLQLRAATLQFEQQQRTFAKFRDDLILDVRAKTREIERARLNLDLAEERVKLNLRRQEEQSLKPDEVTTREQVDTANDLLNSERARDQARADVRSAVLDWLLATGQMRVRPDGQFLPLPGMVMGSATAPPEPNTGPGPPDPLPDPGPDPGPDPNP